MRIGRVVGTVVATRKHAALTGAPLMLVELGGASRAPAILAVDAVQAGVGATVLVVIEGRAAATALRQRRAPVDAAIVGLVDQVEQP